MIVLKDSNDDDDDERKNTKIHFENANANETIQIFKNLLNEQVQKSEK